MIQSDCGSEFKEIRKFVFDTSTFPPVPLSICETRNCVYVCVCQFYW
jgi:hypothetical protein